MPRRLPLPEGMLFFTPTLQLVERLEDRYGSLLKLADDLVQKTLPLSRVLNILCLVYAEAGCKLADETLRPFLWRDAGPSPVALLSDILIDILAPLHDMDAIDAKGGAPGEGRNKAAPA